MTHASSSPGALDTSHRSGAFGADTLCIHAGQELFAIVFFVAESYFLAMLLVSFALLVAMTGFEILVSFLQAFIFTILTAVYIGGAMHPEH